METPSPACLAPAVSAPPAACRVPVLVPRRVPAYRLGLVSARRGPAAVCPVPSLARHHGLAVQLAQASASPAPAACPVNGWVTALVCSPIRLALAGCRVPGPVAQLAQALVSPALVASQARRPARRPRRAGCRVPVLARRHALRHRPRRGLAVVCPVRAPVHPPALVGCPAHAQLHPPDQGKKKAAEGLPARRWAGLGRRPRQVDCPAAWGGLAARLAQVLAQTALRPHERAARPAGGLARLPSLLRAQGHPH